MMTRKFLPLVETYLQELTRGGFLTGYIVKLKPSLFTSDFFKKQTENYKEKLKAWNNSDLLLRVSAVKPIRPTTQGGGNAEITGSEFDVDITQEIAPGRYVDFVTIPGEFLEVVTPKDANLPPIPNSLRRKSKVKIKPEQEETKKDEVSQTFKSDDGKGKLIPGDRELTNKNVKIPSSPAQGDKSPSVKSYTHKYLPKNR